MLPFGAVPLGTFNYFARDNDIPLEPAAAARRLAEGAERPVKIGLVNGRVFLVNASFGLYPMLLEEREAFKQQYGRTRWVALGAALWTILTRTHPRIVARISTDGAPREVRASTLFVGNNPLQLARLGIDHAQAVEAGQLAAIRVRPASVWGLISVLVHGAVGRLAGANEVESFAFRRMEVAPLRNQAPPDVPQGRDRRRKRAHEAAARVPGRAAAAAPRAMSVASPGLRYAFRHRACAGGRGAGEAGATSCARICVVLSGDITQRARRREFDAARRLVERLAAPALLAIPGQPRYSALQSGSASLGSLRRLRAGVRPRPRAVLRVGRPARARRQHDAAYRHKHGEVSAAADRARRRAAEGRRPRTSCASWSPTIRCTCRRVRTKRTCCADMCEAARAWASAGADLVMGGHIHLPFVRRRRTRAGRYGWRRRAPRCRAASAPGGEANSVNLVRCAAGVATVERLDYDGSRFALVDAVRIK